NDRSRAVGKDDSVGGLIENLLGQFGMHLHGCNPFGMHRQRGDYRRLILPLTHRCGSQTRKKPNTIGRRMTAAKRPKPSATATTASRPNTSSATTAIKPRARTTRHAIPNGRGASANRAVVVCQNPIGADP